MSHRTNHILTALALMTAGVHVVGCGDDNFNQVDRTIDAGSQPTATHRFDNIQLSQAQQYSHPLLPDVDLLAIVDIDRDTPDRGLILGGQATQLTFYLGERIQALFPGFTLLKAKGEDASAKLYTKVDLVHLQFPFDTQNARIYLLKDSHEVEVGRMRSPVPGKEILTLETPVLCEQEYESVCRLSMTVDDGAGRTYETVVEHPDTTIQLPAISGTFEIELKNSTSLSWTARSDTP
ncbi:hypothetical protein [Sorangium sp. So ce1389]|uniref:hypothetical protein n=1 Tax=Sorangium sp. So ce1389 TaxID=3133336 RepID=UPI003F5E0578